MADPYFTMFWANDIPGRVLTDANGLQTYISVIAGQLVDADKPTKA